MNQQNPGHLINIQRMESCETLNHVSDLKEAYSFFPNTLTGVLDNILPVTEKCLLESEVTGHK